MQKIQKNRKSKDQKILKNNKMQKKLKEEEKMQKEEKRKILIFFLKSTKSKFLF